MQNQILNQLPKHIHQIFYKKNILVYSKAGNMILKALTKMDSHPTNERSTSLKVNKEPSLLISLHALYKASS